MRSRISSKLICLHLYGNPFLITPDGNVRTVGVISTFDRNSFDTALTKKMQGPVGVRPALFGEPFDTTLQGLEDLSEGVVNAVEQQVR